MSLRIKHKRAVAVGLIMLFAIAWLPIVRGSGRVTPRELRHRSLIDLPQLSLQADLDGDCAVDNVKLSSNGFDKTVMVKFANQRDIEFSFVANTSDPGTLVSKDIDRDGDIDLIWLGNRDQRNDIVLINDGQGDFTRAKDIAPYASELSSLISDSDPTEQDSAQAAHHNGSLTSSSFSDIGVIPSSLLQRPDIQFASFFGATGFSNRAAFLNYLHKRGPPPNLS